MKRRIFSLMLAVFLIIPCACLFGACGNSTDGGDDTQANAKVMNISLNPAIEFVLDQNDQVVTVNALNEDGNHIISVAIDAKTTFEGLSAEEAVDYFLSIAKENGYLITGNQEEIKISISGEAEELLNKVKDKANAYFNANGLKINIIGDSLKKADLLNKVKNCVQEYSEAELNEMTEDELIALLQESRKETKQFLNQDLKDVYYVMRAEKINLAELQALYNLTKSLNIETVKAFNQSMAKLSELISSVETTYQNLLNNEEYVALKNAYISAKETLLEQRLALAEEGFSEEELVVLAGLEEQVAEAKEALETAKKEIEAEIESVKADLESLFNEINKNVDTIKAIIAQFGINVDHLANAGKNIRENFKKHFAEHEVFKDFIGQHYWDKQSA